MIPPTIPPASATNAVGARTIAAMIAPIAEANKMENPPSVNHDFTASHVPAKPVFISFSSQGMNLPSCFVAASTRSTPKMAVIAVTAAAMTSPGKPRNPNTIAPAAKANPATNSCFQSIPVVKTFSNALYRRYPTAAIAARTAAPVNRPSAVPKVASRNTNRSNIATAIADPILGSNAANVAMTQAHPLLNAPTIIVHPPNANPSNMPSRRAVPTFE